MLIKASIHLGNQVFNPSLSFQVSLRLRARVVAAGTVCNWVADYLVISTFLGLTDSVGDQGAFLLYMAINAAAVCFVYFFVPPSGGGAGRSGWRARGASARRGLRSSSAHAPTPCAPHCAPHRAPYRTPHRLQAVVRAWVRAYGEHQ